MVICNLPNGEHDRIVIKRFVNSRNGVILKKDFTLQKRIMVESPGASTIFYVTARYCYIGKSERLRIRQLGHQVGQSRSRFCFVATTHEKMFD